jgi:hypothetical protein
MRKLSLDPVGVAHSGSHRARCQRESVVPKVACFVVEAGAQQPCGRPSVAKGLCQMHYKRQQKWGDPKKRYGHTDEFADAPVKRCSACREVKPVSEFPSHPGSAGGRRRQCKDCHNARSRTEYARRPEVRAQAKARNRKSLYGLTQEDFDALFAAQDGVCAICRGPATKKGFVVDHCHDTKRVRGIVCHPCNLLIGFAQDDPDRLRAAISYLESTEGICR